jgi:hypothetical protein
MTHKKVRSQLLFITRLPERQPGSRVRHTWSDRAWYTSWYTSHALRTITPYSARVYSCVYKTMYYLERSVRNCCLLRGCLSGSPDRASDTHGQIALGIHQQDTKLHARMRTAALMQWQDTKLHARVPALLQWQFHKTA